MKNVLFCIILLFFCSILTAQKLNIWVGNAPGRPTDWHYYKNWSLGKVPDSFSDVVIPDCYSKGNKYPVLKGKIDVNSIEIAPSAKVTVDSFAEITIQSGNWEDFKNIYLVPNKWAHND